MSGIQRLTLISDPTNEFPQNANNSFKVQLPERLQLPGGPWYASLLALTVPDEGQRSGVIASDPHTKIIRFGVMMTVRKKLFGTYRRIEFKRKDYTFELEDVMNANLFVTSNFIFWQRMTQAVHNKIMIKLTKEQEDALSSAADEVPIVSLKKNWMPTLSWKGETLILQAIPKAELMKSDKTAVVTYFSIHYTLAEQFGFRHPNTGWGVQIGTQFTVHPPQHHLHQCDRTPAFLHAIDL